MRTETKGSRWENANVDRRVELSAGIVSTSYRRLKGKQRTASIRVKLTIICSKSLEMSSMLLIDLDPRACPLGDRPGCCWTDEGAAVC